MAKLHGNEAEALRPRIGVTIGDPAGIGPEVTLKAVTSDEVLAVCAPVIIGDAAYLAHWSRIFNLARGLDVINAPSSPPESLEAPVVHNLNNVPGSIEI